MTDDLDQIARDAAAELADAKADAEPAPAPRAARTRKATKRRRTTTRRAPAAPAAPKRPSRADLTERVSGLFGGVSVALIAAGTVRQSPALLLDAQAVAESADDLAAALVKVGDQYPAVRRFLETITMGSAFTDLAIAAGGLAYRIAQNHGVLAGPPSSNGAGGGFDLGALAGFMAGVPDAAAAV